MFYIVAVGSMQHIQVSQELVKWILPIWNIERHLIILCVRVETPITHIGKQPPMALAMLALFAKVLFVQIVVVR